MEQLEWVCSQGYVDKMLWLVSADWLERLIRSGRREVTIVPFGGAGRGINKKTKIR